MEAIRRMAEKAPLGYPFFTLGVNFAPVRMPVSRAKSAPEEAPRILLDEVYPGERCSRQRVSLDFSV